MKAPVKEMSSLFVYGTLMAPQVIETLIDRLPSHTSAILKSGYRRHPVRNYAFPGLIPAVSSSISMPITGVLYRGVTEPELMRLDRFEGDEYRKQTCTVEVADGKHDAQVYVWANPESELDISKPWSYENFRTKDLEIYLDQVVRPCRTELDRIMKS